MSLAETINVLCEARIGRVPDLVNPRGYNDLIQWLKLHDQRADHVTACDKWAVRKWVADRAGEDVLIPARNGLHADFLPCIAKCTHDSGSARMIRNAGEIEAARAKLTARLARPYGVAKGEWAYRFVPPRIISESVLPGPVVDYKFHCSHGQVRWVQVIWDRGGVRPKEAIFSPDGTITGLHMDHKMAHTPDRAAWPGDAAWTALTALAQLLAKAWRYVRVDLYWSGARAWFGELTFWPLAGCYLTDDEPWFGELLALDLTEKMEPIVS